MYKTILCFLLLVLIKAQDKIIEGRIIDSQNNLALPGAEIRLSGTGFSKISEQNGSFVFLKLDRGTYTINVNYIGYKEFKKEIRIPEDSKSEIIIKLEPGIISGNEVLVFGERLKGQAKALNQQMNVLNITNVVSADQLGRFPDANIGDAMKRIPSITVEYDQGEARFGLIRGTQSRLNSVTINGERIPSAEGETRSVQLDLIPSDMVQSIEVSKALTADMDADAIGGSVNLVTRSTPVGQRISITAGSGISTLRKEPIYNFSGVYGNRINNGKLGYVLSASYNNHTFGSDNVEVDWERDNSNNPIIEELQVRRYDLQRLRRSLSGSFDYKIDSKNNLFLNGMITDRFDWENRYRVKYKIADNEIVRETKGGINNDDNKSTRLEKQITHHTSLGGKHYFDNITLNWSGSYGYASERRPNERYIGWIKENVNQGQNIVDPEEPKAFVTNAADNDLSTYEIDEITEENKFTKETDINGRLDIELPFQNSALKFGTRYRSKDKNRKNNFFEYESSALQKMTDSELKDLTENDYAAGDYRIGKFTSKDYLGRLQLTNANKFNSESKGSEFVTKNYDAKEKIIAAYTMYNHNFDKISLNIGLRYEKTDIDYTGYRFEKKSDQIIELKDTKDYNNVLPSLHLKYTVNPKTYIRAAWTNTLSRPNYYDLVPYIYEDKKKEKVEFGNPSLNATKSMNLDLLFDHYFNSVGMISTGVFYKKIKDFIFYYTKEQNYRFIGETTPIKAKISQALNGSNASLAGFELAFQSQLGFIKGLENFGVYSNYTYTWSEIDGLPITGRENDNIGLPGSAEHTLNASLSYENKAFSARFSLNYTSDFLSADDDVSDKAYKDRYYDEVIYLDFNASYKFEEIFTAYLELNNIGNQPLRYYQGESKYTMQAEYYKMRIQAGLKVDF